MHMAEPVISPDGKMMWSGTDWIPLPPTQLQMSRLRSYGWHKYQNRTYCTSHLLARYRKLVRNHLNMAAEKMGLGLFTQSDRMYEKAKHIDYELATELYNGDFCKTFVAALWIEWSSHAKMGYKDHTLVWEFTEDRIS